MLTFLVKKIVGTPISTKVFVSGEKDLNVVLNPILELPDKTVFVLINQWGHKYTFIKYGVEQYLETKEFKLNNIESMNPSFVKSIIKLERYNTIDKIIG